MTEQTRLREWGPFWRLPGMVGIRWRRWQFDITDNRVLPPLFSERYGHQRHPHVGPFCLRGGRLNG